ncbi:13087_t:CDS:1 [Funneliformis caledonium]|uniref:13087_t:CDS:1 n=2 Tax=Funneliformis TaxID=1117308 RepID=A0A9N8V7G9_9GLOM|nr:13087_t:CDS:1 [Funneliformis caledonium]CAG8530411.1 10852_t:CDS:1 [Funneliformis mosseae]
MHASTPICNERVIEHQPQSPCKSRHFTAIEGIPSTYILEKLHQLGPRYFGDKSTAFVELYVEGIEKPFWIHEEYLVLQSVFFQESLQNVTSGDVITINVPSPDTFEPILRYLYDGDADKWYDTFTLENYYDVWQNIEFLGLGIEAQAICLAYYQKEVEKLLDEEMVEDDMEDYIR